MVCRFSEPAPGLIPWLTVRHHRASTGMHWRRGVFLRHPIQAYASEALIELHHSGELVVEVRAPSPDLYFNVLRDSVEDLISRRWPGLTYQLFIPCPGEVGASKCQGQFPLDTLLRMREQGRTSVTCYECVEDYEVSLLLTGFTMPAWPLGTELDEIHNQLARIERGVVRIEGQAADMAESVRRVLRVVSAEVTDCPRLFTLVRYARSFHYHQHLYVLTLWCEHPEYWHPWEPATYHLDVTKEWFAKIRPYVKLIFRTLQLVVPPAGAIAEELLRGDQLARAEGLVKLMNSLVVDLPAMRDENLGNHSEVSPLASLPLRRAKRYARYVQSCLSMIACVNLAACAVCRLLLPTSCGYAQSTIPSMTQAYQLSRKLLDLLVTMVVAECRFRWTSVLDTSECRSWPCALSRPSIRYAPVNPVRSEIGFGR